MCYLNSGRVLGFFIFLEERPQKKVASVNHIFSNVSCGHNFWQLQMTNTSPVNTAHYTEASRQNKATCSHEHQEEK